MLNNLLLVTSAIAFNVFAQCLMRYNGLHTASLSYVQTLFSINAMLSVVMYGVSFACMLIAMKTNELSVLAPVSGGISFVLIYFVSVVVFSESFTINKTLGVFFIIVGIYFLNK